jgi:peptide/nickel transport system substrate-binding protein
VFAGATAALTSLASAQPADPAVTVVLAVELDSLDACDTQQAQNANIVRGNIYESLTHVSAEDASVEPLLALSWERVDDLTWEFKLRPDVTFHDGSTFNAEVAAANVNRSQPGFQINGEPIACLNISRFPQPMTAEAVDDLTLRVTTSVPDPILPLRLSYVDVGNLESQSTVQKATQPVGTGPYQFVERVQGETVRLTRFDGYWGEVPQVKDVTYLFRAEPAVRASMIQTGEADIATAISPQDATDDGSTVEYRDNRIVLARPNATKEPFVDRRVRQAVSHAIDRETITSVLMGISGAPWCQMLGPQVDGYIEDFDCAQVGYDPEKAAALIEEARADGVPVDTEFELVTRPDLFPHSDEVVQAIAQGLEAIGLRPRIRSMENTAWRVYLRQPFPADQPGSLLMVSHDNTSGDASFSFPNYIVCEGINSATCNPEIDRLVAEAEQAEGDQRERLWEEAARILYVEEAGIIGIAEQIRLMMLSERVEYEANPLSGLEIRIADVQVTE